MDAAREELLARLGTEADRITEVLVRRGCTLVVACGSFARGQVGRASDLDMLAVMDSDLPFIARLGVLYEEIAPTVGLDLLVYTPAEFAVVRERAFLRRALAEGKVLHAA